MKHLSQRDLFLQYVAQTSDFPPMLEIARAQGACLYDVDGKEYIDLIAGISVCNLGHCHPDVVKAISEQASRYMHVMVYGEFVLSPQVQLAQLLADNLPLTLNSTYFVNSGSEAIEGAMKLAKRYTRRPEIVAFNNAYHGGTTGALSLFGDAAYRQAFMPLLPGIRHIDINNLDNLDQITQRTACVIIEPIQGEAGIVAATTEFLTALRARCNETGTLLVFDEVQTGFGRTGKLFAFEHYGVVPDILCLAKGMGGGMPIGAFIASKEIMDSLKNNPVLGHITTFGGHPVSCAAALASFNVILQSGLMEQITAKEAIIKDTLSHPAIKSIRGKGLFYAVELQKTQQALDVVALARQNGVITDWFLFNDNSIRIAPPLIISDEQLQKACEILVEAIEKIGVRRD